VAALPRIAVDAMGGDAGPGITVPAALAVAGRAELVLVGDSDRLHAALGSLAHSPSSNLRIHHAAQQLVASDTLADVLRRRPDSSMRQALLLHAAGEVDGVVSGGDTAALMALSRSIMDMVPGVERPAICKELQGMRGPFWMLDLGANIDCTVEQLCQFARMGTTLARHAGGIAEPRVGLLNIGTEAGKGPALLSAAARQLDDDPSVNYAGFVEGNVLFSDVVDVVVADGFGGNVALKSIEGAARMAGHLLRGWLDELGPLERAGMLLARRRLQKLRQELNPQRYNGATFVGLSGVVVKGHGSADVEGFQSAIEEAIVEVQGQIPRRLADTLAGGVVRPG
jgi:phosphate acyltransferase